MAAQAKTPERDRTRYPLAVQRAGMHAALVYDRVFHGLVGDGYSADEAEMLIAHDLDQIIEAGRLEEATARAKKAVTGRDD